MAHKVGRAPSTHTKKKRKNIVIMLHSRDAVIFASYTVHVYLPNLPTYVYMHAYIQYMWCNITCRSLLLLLLSPH